MHRYQGGTSSILYSMSNLGSASGGSLVEVPAVGKAPGGSLVEVPAEPRESCWGQQRVVTEDGVVDTGKADSAPESVKCLSGLSAPQNGV